MNWTLCMKDIENKLKYMKLYYCEQRKSTNLTLVIRLLEIQL